MVAAEALVQERDNGAVLLKLQSMGETTFDSSQLVLSACYGFPTIDEELLQSLRDRHRPAVIAALHKRSLDTRQWRTAKLDTTTNGSLPAVDLPTTAVDELRSTVEAQFSGQNCVLNGTDEESSALESQFSAPKCLSIDEERNNLELDFKNISEVEERATLKYQLSAPKFFTVETLVSNQKRFFKGGPISRIDEADEHEEAESFDLQKEVQRWSRDIRRASRCAIKQVDGVLYQVEFACRVSRMTLGAPLCIDAPLCNLCHPL